MKVYMVSEGSYSDFGYLAAFSTKEKAEEFIRVQNLRRPNYNPLNDYVEEFDIDSNEAVFPEKAWFVLREIGPISEPSIQGVDAYDDEHITELYDGSIVYVVQVNYSENQADMIKAGMDKVAMLKAREAGI